MPEESGLERLTKKYGQHATSVGRTDVYQQFDTKTSSASKQRVGQEPEMKVMGSSEVTQQMTQVKLDLARLARKYGKLGLNFKNLLGKNSVYTAGDLVGYLWYASTRQTEKLDKLQVEAAGRHNEAINTLIDMMADVLGDQYQKAVQGKDLSEKLQVQNVALINRLHDKMTTSLKNSHYTGADLATAESEVEKITSELSDINSIISEYETKINTSRSEGKLDDINKYTEELGQVVDMEKGVLDGKLSADGLVSEIRRNILDATKGVQSAKGAIAASRVNYQAISTLIDSMNELEISYRHAKEDMLPVFRIQGQIATIGMTGMDIKQTLLEVSEISTRLLDVNANLVMALANETYELMKNPIYDIEAAKKVETRIKDYRAKLNQLKMDWVQNNQKISDLAAFVEEPHYAKHE
jgi:hypothetical protein